MKAGPDSRQGTEVAREGTSPGHLQGVRNERLLHGEVKARHRHAIGIVGRRQVKRLELTAASVVVNLKNSAFGVTDDNGIEERLAERRIGAGHDAAKHRAGAAATPVVRDLACAIEVGMQAADEEEVVIS